MAEIRLAATDPLATIGQIPLAGLHLEPAPFRLRFAFQADERSAARIAEALGFSERPAILRAVAAESSALLRLGPDEYRWLGVLEAAVSGRTRLPDAAIEVSQGACAVLLRGERLMPVLATGCPLDLDARAFPVGMATRTLFGRFEIVLWRQHIDRFYIEFGRSFAASFLDFLRESGRFSG